MKAIDRYAAMVLGLIYGLFFLFMSINSIPFHWKAREIEGFFIHSIPSIIVILGAIIGFKRPGIGMVIFFIITIITIIYFNTYKDISNFMVISFPALVVALLFMISLKKLK